jgi:hypothetical protein
LTTLEVARSIYCVAAEYDEPAKQWEIDLEQTEKLRGAMRQKRLQRGKPIAEWWEEEKGKLERGELAPEVIEMYRECMGLSEKFAQAFRGFWKFSDDFAF